MWNAIISRNVQKLWNGGVLEYCFSAKRHFTILPLHPDHRDSPIILQFPEGTPMEQLFTYSELLIFSVPFHSTGVERDWDTFGKGTPAERDKLINADTIN